MHLKLLSQRFYTSFSIFKVSNFCHKIKIIIFLFFSLDYLAYLIAVLFFFSRLVKGSGEILEECVSKERHKAINQAATQSDGNYFESTIKAKANNSWKLKLSYLVS